MNNEDFSALQPGDMVKHASSDSDTYMVTGNYGGRVTAVRTVDLTNSIEWNIALRAEYATYSR